jgi:hypothetical protein
VNDVQFARKLIDAQFRAMIGALSRGGTFKVFAGAEPPDCASEDPQGLLAEIELPKRALHEHDGAVENTGAWVTYGGEGAGKGRLARSFRLCDYDDDVIVQGSITAHEDGGDLLIANPSVAKGEKFVISKFRFEFWVK